MWVDEDKCLPIIKRPSAMEEIASHPHHRHATTLIHLTTSRLGASHMSMPVAGLVLTFTRNPSCLMNQSLYTVHSASFSAISISKRNTSSGMSLFISISEMFLPKQVRGPRPNCSRQFLYTSFVVVLRLFSYRESEYWRCLRKTLVCRCGGVHQLGPPAGVEHWQCSMDV